MVQAGKQWEGKRRLDIVCRGKLDDERVMVWAAASHRQVALRLLENEVSHKQEVLETSNLRLEQHFRNLLLDCVFFHPTSLPPSVNTSIASFESQTSFDL
ncbi:hypothetical protein KC335_g73 [Hortaea werneckii]|nr:hypothetical protein KC335_g73 [Hortaea werneckii]